MKRKLYLHIGCEKTGTTSIQDCLFINKDNLKKNGYYFLQSMGQKNNRKLTCYSITEKVNDELYRNLLKKFSDKKNIKNHIEEELEKEILNIDNSIENVLITSEHFSSRLFLEEELLELKNLLDRFFEEITIICYFREQSKACQSLFSTGIKSGSANKLDFYIKECNSKNPYYNYFNMAKIWSNVFGKSNLKLRIFDRKNFKDGSVLNDFFSLIDPNLFSNLIIPKPSNESLNKFGQDLGIEVNSKFNKLPKTDSNLKLKRQILNLISKNFIGKGYSIEIEDFKRIYYEFEKDNIELNSFLGDGSFNCFEYQIPQSDIESEKTDFYYFFVELINLLITEKEYDINLNYKLKKNLEMLTNLEKINFNSLKQIKKIRDFN